jgi:hypothetical protein
LIKNDTEFRVPLSIGYSENVCIDLVNNIWHAYKIKECKVICLNNQMQEKKVCTILIGVLDYAKKNNLLDTLV